MSNRKHSIIDALPPDIKETVDEMIKADFTYHEIVEYIRTTGQPISLSAVGRYAKSLNITIQALRMTQENFRAIMDETEKYPNLDITEGIMRLLSNQILQTINSAPEDYFRELEPDELIKQSLSLAKAVAYKKNIDSKSKDLQAAGLEQVKGMLFESLAAERPELYSELTRFLKSKEVT